jgi:hypothetical protein
VTVGPERVFKSVEEAVRRTGPIYEAGSCGVRVPRFAQRRVILFFWPIRASSENQISILSLAIDFWRAMVSTRGKKLF